MSIAYCAALAWAGAGPKARPGGGKRGHHSGQPSVLSGAVEAKLRASSAGSGDGQWKSWSGLNYVSQKGVLESQLSEPLNMA